MGKKKKKEIYARKDGQGEKTRSRKMKWEAKKQTETHKGAEREHKEGRVEG